MGGEIEGRDERGRGGGCGGGAAEANPPLKKNVDADADDEHGLLVRDYDEPGGTTWVKESGRRKGY